MYFMTYQVKIHVDSCGKARIVRRNKPLVARVADYVVSAESDVGFYDLGVDNMLSTYAKYQALKQLMLEADV
jgi:hypothetical protein